MKLVSSSPKTKHTHTVRSEKSWFWSRVRSRLSSTQFIKRISWLLLVAVVATFAISVFHVFRQALENSLSQ